MSNNQLKSRKFDSVLSKFGQCVSANRAGNKSVEYAKTINAFEINKNEQNALEEEEIYEKAEPPKLQEETLKPSDKEEVKLLQPSVREDKNAILKINVVETELGEMTYLVEVEAGNHNSRFYEIQNKDITTLANIFTSHPRARNVELVATPLNTESNGKALPKNSWKSRGLKLNTTHFQRLRNLRTLCVKLNGLLELSVSSPFYFPINELSLSDIDIRLYDFGLLIRSVGHSLQHLCLEKIRIVDSSESNDYLVQLQRIRSLQSLRLDLGLSEAYPSLSEVLVCKCSTIFVASVSLDFFFNTIKFDLANTVFTQRIIYKHNSYGLEDIQSLEQAVEDRRRRNKPVLCKLKLVIGLPNNWTTRAEQCNCVSVFKIGSLEICRLLPEESSLGDLSIKQLDRTLFKLKL